VNLVNFGSSEFKDSDFKFIKFVSLWRCLKMNLRIVNLLNLIVLGNVKCEIHVYGCMFVMVVGDEFLSTS
jgi:hypothetical protein